jgi:deoxyribose-phosphate aldolase
MKIKLILEAGVTGVEEKLAAAMEQAVEHRADYIEISYGSHAGETKRRILNFLMKEEYRKLYSRLVKSKEGWGRIFVHFKWK